MPHIRRAPVDQIGLTFGPRARGWNLVGRQAVMRADFLRVRRKRAGNRLVRRFIYPRMQSEKRRLLDRELVEREMLGGFRNRELQFIAHICGVWSGRA